MGFKDSVVLFCCWFNLLMTSVAPITLSYSSSVFSPAASPPEMSLVTDIWGQVSSPALYLMNFLLMWANRGAFGKGRTQVEREGNTNITLLVTLRVFGCFFSRGGHRWWTIKGNQEEWLSILIFFLFQWFSPSDTPPCTSDSWLQVGRVMKWSMFGEGCRVRSQDDDWMR